MSTTRANSVNRSKTQGRAGQGTTRRSSSSSHPASRKGQTSSKKHRNSRKNNKTQNIARLLTAMVALLAVIFLLFRCSTKEETSYESSTAVFGKNGKVRVVSVEDFDPELYSEKELDGVIREELSKYNKGEKRIDLEAFFVKDGKAYLELVYDSCDDYVQFNQLDMFNGTVKDALAQGYSFDSVLSATSTEDSSKILSANDLESLGDHQAIFVMEPMDLVVPRRILYAGSNLSITDNRSAKVSGNVSRDEPAVIIMK